MKITEILDADSIIADLKAKGKRDVISELVELLVKSGKVRDKNKLLDALMERERLGSTGIGENVAIPHAKSNEIDTIIATFGRSNGGISFDSLDQKPVYFVFLLIAPEKSAGMHLKTLARISKLLKNPLFRQDLIKAKNEKEIYEAISREDSKLI
ncbi:MAG: PTS sugar transporter subunit IIA [Nitrospinae bacterium]|nr:PTS sugar transporter subunit IIA [Nitrospinota bacterium]